MIYLDPVTGIVDDSAVEPGPGWQPVPGRGMLFRRREAGGWKAAHAYGPDAPLWHRRGWERVRLRPAAPALKAQRGQRSSLRYCFAELESEPGRATSRLPIIWVWVVLPDEVGWESPAARPGAQARFRLDVVAQGVPPEQIAERLFTARILALDIPLERALWVLKGPPVSPDDSRLRRKMEPILRLAERLSSDLVDGAEKLTKSTAMAALTAPDSNPPPVEPAAIPRRAPTPERVPVPASRRGSRPRTKRDRTDRASS